MKKIFPSLVALLMDYLRIHKIASYEELEDITRKNKYKPETFTRRFRKNGGDSLGDYPVAKLNKFKKPLEDGDRVFFYKYIGGKTYFKKLIIK